jgi:hypothetical protein
LLVEYRALTSLPQSTGELARDTEIGILLRLPNYLPKVNQLEKSKDIALAGRGGL